MSNANHLTRGYLDRLCGTLFLGDPPLDPCRQLITTPVWQIGDRVIVPPTNGAIDPASRKGGPGEVVSVREWDGTLSPMAYVVLDDSTEPAQPYRFDELKREPTV